VRTVRNAATPRPVKEASRAAYVARHPVGAVENKLIEATLYPQVARRRKRGFWWSWLTGRAAASEPVGARQPIVPPTAPVPTRPVPGRPSTVQPWPARQAFRTPPSDAAPRLSPQMNEPSSAGEWELQARRRTGLGDGSRSQ
jgi:hypothetical protein